ncbi:MAG: MFS transporter [Candidatus Kariarchaeaceae archaeon]|jgi:Na+/melibiose symporter-like transporter
MTTQKPISVWLIPIIGLGFATTQLSWALFNIAVPLFLEETFGISLFLIGFIMTWDNIIAFFIQPYIGARSDTTRTRLGRRFPYIIPGVILGATFFFLIHVAAGYALIIFLGTIVLFNLSMALYRSPAVSLMPDLVAPERRSVGNGIINLMGGVFSGASLFVAGALLSDGNTTGAFAFVSIGMVVSLVVLVAIIREPDYAEEGLKGDALEQHDSVMTTLMKEISVIRYSSDRSYLFMLFAILSWFMAWNAIEAFYSLYVAEKFLPDLPRLEAGGQASSVIFIFPVVFVVFTLVGGLLGTAVGRLPTMRLGLLVFTVAILLGAFVEADGLFGLTSDWQSSYTIIFILAGAAWGLVNVNSIVVIWHHATDNGAGTGIYYAFSSAAAILGPTLVGPLMDINVEMLFPFSIVFLVLANLFLTLVKTGEADDPSIGMADPVAEMID